MLWYVICEWMNKLWIVKLFKNWIVFLLSVSLVCDCRVCKILKENLNNLNKVWYILHAVASSYECHNAHPRFPWMISVDDISTIRFLHVEHDVYIESNPLVTCYVV